MQANNSDFTKKQDLLRKKQETPRLINIS